MGRGGDSLGPRSVTGIVVLGLLLIACGSPVTRGTIVQFFPPLADEALQAASFDAVVHVLHRHGATISSPATAEVVRASIPLECSGRRGVAEFRFARSAGPQTVGVRICPSGSSGRGCVEGAPDVRPAGPCRDSTARLLSSIEHDLAESLMGRVALANRKPRPWWGGASLGSLESLLLLSHPAERNEWWRGPSDGSQLSARPLWNGGRVAAVQTTRSRAITALSQGTTPPQPTTGVR